MFFANPQEKSSKKSASEYRGVDTPGPSSNQNSVRKSLPPIIRSEVGLNKPRFDNLRTQIPLGSSDGVASSRYVLTHTGPTFLKSNSETRKKEDFTSLVATSGASTAKGFLSKSDAKGFLSKADNYRDSEKSERDTLVSARFGSRSTRRVARRLQIQNLKRRELQDATEAARVRVSVGVNLFTIAEDNTDRLVDIHVRPESYKRGQQDSGATTLAARQIHADFREFNFETHVESGVRLLSLVPVPKNKV